jgi:DNA-binding transcriptional ArsR family regulator
MPVKQEVASFIRANFRSVWSLELLLFLKKNRQRSWSNPEMVAALRGSDSVVSHSVDALLAAGLVTIEEDGAARYTPASADIARLADGAEALYASSPDAVRRLIVLSSNGGLTAFADAFRLRRD